MNTCDMAWLRVWEKLFDHDCIFAEKASMNIGESDEHKGRMFQGKNSEACCGMRNRPAQLRRKKWRSEEWNT